MQKRFFKFGEVGVVIYYIPAPVNFDTGKNIFIFCPINLTIKPMALAKLRDKNYKYYIFCKVMMESYLDDRAFLTLIRQKTKEALESKGTTISDSEFKDKIKHLYYKDI